MARIRIDDLPLGENLTPEQEELILGAGRRTFRPTLESLENREMMDASIGSVAMQRMLDMAQGAQIRWLAQETSALQNQNNPLSQSLNQAGQALLTQAQQLNTNLHAAVDHIFAAWSHNFDQVVQNVQSLQHVAANPIQPFMKQALVKQQAGAVNPLLAPTKGEADGVLKTNYAQWKKTFVRQWTENGHLVARVARPDGHNAYLGVDEDTVSEGMGYGMLLSAYNGDKTTFDALWAFAKQKFNGNGLMSWHIAPDGGVAKHDGAANSATDGDEDMAMALIKADKTWGGYTADAKALIGNIMEHEVEKGTNVLKPGDAWGGSDKTNPSYFAPAYYKVFQEYTGDPRWGAVADKAYEILAKAANPKTGLVPNWVTADGTPLDDSQTAQGPKYYGYDAMRTPWRIALDAVWYNDPRAIDYLTKVNAFFKTQRVQGIQDKYNLDGSIFAGTCHNAAGVSMAATAAVIDGDLAYRQSFWKETVNVSLNESQNYYNESLRSLSLLLIGGGMAKPV